MNFSTCKPRFFPYIIINNGHTQACIFILDIGHFQTGKGKFIILKIAVESGTKKRLS